MSALPELFVSKNVLKICSTFTREHPCGSVLLTCVSYEQKT